MSYLPPLGHGQRRYRLVRANVSLKPEVFDRLRAKAEREGKPISQAGAELIEASL